MTPGLLHKKINRHRLSQTRVNGTMYYNANRVNIVNPKQVTYFSLYTHSHTFSDGIFKASLIIYLFTENVIKTSL